MIVLGKMFLLPLIPAQAGTQFFLDMTWVPAFAGTSGIET
jgi:hypothetical protein